MSSLPGIMPIIQKAIDQKLNSISFTDIMVGEVTSMEPVQILIDDRLEIGVEFLDFSTMLLEPNVSPTSPQYLFEKGDKVFIIRYKKGQRYYVLDLIDRVLEHGIKEVLWSDIKNKPSTFPPTEHEHNWSEVTNKPEQAIRWPTWNEVTSKPTSFTPSSHTHPWSEVIGKPSTYAPQLDKIYPIGAIYISTVSTNPGTLLGGIWVAFGTGRTLVGVDTSQTEFNSVEKTGGHKEIQAHTHSFSGTTNSTGSHTHSASTNTTGAHTHSVTGNTSSDGGHQHGSNVGWGAGGTSTTQLRTDTNRPANVINTSMAANHTHTVSGTAASNGNHSHTVTVNANGNHTHTISGTTGSHGAGNAGNLQPYITVYMWKRTA